jgi:HAD superfamily hydrolase (TIGR01549 family)
VTPPVVLLDVDFTILHPVSVFSGEGYAELAAGFGVTLVAERYEEARLAALAAVFGRAHTLDHDGEEHSRFTELVVEGMGGSGEPARAAARAAAEAWNDPANFALYDDVLPVLEQLCAAGVCVGLVSNTHRELEAFLESFELPVRFALSSRAHGRVKPCPTIFEAALQLAGADPRDGVMVGDSLDADVAGAQAAGLRGILLDRDDRHGASEVERIRSLRELPRLVLV